MAQAEQSDKGNMKNAQRPRRVVLYVLAALVCIYVASYISLSLLGGYVSVASGRTRMPWGFSSPDISAWQPRGVVGYSFTAIGGARCWQANLAGIIYRPLVMLDQRYWHPTDYSALEKMRQERKQ